MPPSPVVVVGPVEKRKEIDPVYFLSKLSKTLIGLVGKRKEIDPVYFVSKLSKILIGLILKKKSQFTF